MFEDEESRAFYESLVDLRAVVPAVLLGEKGKEGGGEQEGGAAAGSEQAESGGEACGKRELPGSASSASLGSSKQELSYDDILEVSIEGTCLHACMLVSLLLLLNTLPHAVRTAPAQPSIYCARLLRPSTARLSLTQHRRARAPAAAQQRRARRVVSPPSWTFCWAACRAA